MSAEQGAAKRACLREDVPWHNVIVSNFGDMRPEEALVDELTTFLVNQGRSVTNYVVVPDFGTEPFFLANIRYGYDEDVYNKDKTKVLYTKGTLKKQYVKEMIPNTKYVRGIRSEVMFLFCHGGLRNAAMRSPIPGWLAFQEPHSVTVGGQVPIGNTPDSARIWSCKEYTAWDDALHEEVTYTRRPGGVTLSDVVHRCDLVFLFSCCTGPILEEYGAEVDGRQKPDLVAFSRSVPIHDISVNIFIALLVSAMEQRQPTGRRLYYDDIVRMLVCQVMLWVQEHGQSGNAAEHGKHEDVFWKWLSETGLILPGQNGGTEDEFRIKGGLHTYALVHDKDLEKHDKAIVLEELQSLTLMLWNDGDGEVPRGYAHITSERPRADLESGRDYTVDWRTYGRSAPPTREASPAHTQPAHDMSLGTLLCQLQGLAC
jgi:hypothetical protein